MKRHFKNFLRKLQLLWGTYTASTTFKEVGSVAAIFVLVGSIVKATNFSYGMFSNDRIVLGILLIALFCYLASLTYFALKHPFHVDKCKWSPCSPPPEGVDPIDHENNRMDDLLTIPRNFEYLKKIATVYLVFDERISDVEIKFEPDKDVKIHLENYSNTMEYNADTGILKPENPNNWEHRLRFMVSIERGENWDNPWYDPWEIEVRDRKKQLFEIECVH